MFALLLAFVGLALGVSDAPDHHEFLDSSLEVARIGTVPSSPATLRFTLNQTTHAWSPAELDAIVLDTVRWQNLGRNNNVVRLTDEPDGLEEACAMAAAYGSITDEFSGPIRVQVPGIWAKGPPNPGVGAVIIPDTETCDCEPGCAPVPEVGGYKYCGNEDGETQSVPPEFWAKDGFAGTFVSINWSVVEADSDGDYDFSVLDTITDLAGWHNKGVIVGFSTAADATPSWMSGTSCSVVSVEGTNDNSPGPNNCGTDYEVINIADPDCLEQVTDLYDAYHAHLIQNNMRFMSVVGLNAMGLNTLTDEVKTFNSCPDRFDNDLTPCSPAGTCGGPDGILDKYGTDECTCNTQKWAQAGYTEEVRDAWYVNQIGHIRTLEGWDNIPVRFMSLDAGLPRVESPTNFLGDSLCTADTTGTCTAADMLCTGGACGATPVLAAQNDNSIPGPSPQLDDLIETLLTAFGSGMEFGNAGLDMLPQEQGATQNCAYTTQVYDPPFTVVGDVHTAQFLPERGNHISNNGFPGCPHGRTVNIGFDGYWTAWQPHNSGNLGCDTVLCQESVIGNMLANTRGDRLELYGEQIFMMLFDPAIGSDEPLAPARTALGCDNGNAAVPSAGEATSAGGAPCNVMPYSKSFAEYTDEMYTRRAAFTGEVAPTAISKQMTEPGEYWFLDTSVCGMDGVGGNAFVGHLTVN